MSNCRLAFTGLPKVCLVVAARNLISGICERLRTLIELVLHRGGPIILKALEFENDLLIRESHAFAGSIVGSMRLIPDNNH